MKRLNVRRALAAVAAASALGGCTSDPAAPVDIAASPSGQYAGIALPGARPLPAITLTDTTGRPFNLARHDDHPVTLLFTGYTSCPDVCPTTMSDIATALRHLTPSETKRIQVIFITTDPRRDSLPAIRAWLDKFDPHFIGLRGTHEQVLQVSGQLGLPLPEDDGTTHSSEVLAFTQRHGSIVAWLQPTPTDLAHDLRLLTNQAAP